jgi:aminoglycoside phosphotransferase (APT) family kinase protein
MSNVSTPLSDVPERALAWCLQSIAGAGRIASAERLRGGIDFTTHALSVERAGQPPLEVVLRRFTREPLPNWPRIGREVATLTALQRHFSDADVAVPVALAHDADGSVAGEPAILLSRVPGRIDTRVEGSRGRVSELARGLAIFHAARIPAPSEVRNERVSFERREEPVPPGIAAPDWKAAWRALERLVITLDQLIHHDYHIGNVLFEQGKLSGIVDWSAAAFGSAAFDVGYCRMDLAMTFGRDAADDFLQSYEDARQQRIADLPLWDIAGAVRAFPDPAMWLHGWHDAGRVELTADTLRERLAVFVERALSRL